MRVKIGIFLFVLLFIVGCGVMNNPKSDKLPEDGIVNDAGVFLEVSKIDSTALLGSNDIEILNNYKIFETKQEADIFLNDLNSSYGNIPVVQNWITNIQNKHIEYTSSNLLFYPILQSSNCGRKDNLTIADSNVTIKISSSLEDCATTFAYHVLIYQVPKSIKNITIKAYEDSSVTILNKKN